MKNLKLELERINLIKLLLCQVYEDVSVGHGRRGYPQECYENTDTFRHPGPLHPSPSEPDMRGQTDYQKTSADNPLRATSPQVSNSFKSLLVGPGKGGGPSADLLKRLEDAISSGDHK